MIDNQTMKTDKLFYRIFLSQPDLISELVPDIPSICEFDYSTPIIKETELRLDGLLTHISDDLRCSQLMSLVIGKFLVVAFALNSFTEVYDFSPCNPFGVAQMKDESRESRN